MLIDGKEIKDNKEIANTLNDYFADIEKYLSDNIPLTEKSFKDYLKHPTPASIFLRPTNFVEAGREIDKLKSKNPFSTNCKIDVITFVKSEIIEGLTIIVNLSILEGKVQDLLKVVKIIPVYRNGDSCSPSNYRLISLLTIFDKILEKQFTQDSNIF